MVRFICKLDQDIREKELTSEYILASGELSEESRISLVYVADEFMKEWKDQRERYLKEYQEKLSEIVRTDTI